METKRFVYADNAATTALDPQVIDAMLEVMRGEYGNPSSLYGIGRRAKSLVEHAREQLAAVIGAQPGEVYFTACGTEADNWAIRGTADRHHGCHIITSAFEHHAVLETVQALEKEGHSVTYLGVTPEGLVRPEDVEAAIRPETALVTIMLANNEIGTIQPIADIAKITQKRGIPLHTDAVQAVGHIPVNVDELGVNLLSLSAHKFHGPKGVGALYIKKGTRLNTFMHGGAQERNRRAGTENVAGIVGMGLAAQLAADMLPSVTPAMTALRDRLIEGILQIPYTRLNGHAAKRLPGNVNVSINFIEGESLLLMLDAQGICASSGSACTSGSLDPSHVLLAIGLEHGVAHGSLRLSLSHLTTDEDVDYILGVLPGVVERLRDMSPLWDAKSNAHAAGKED